MNKNCGNFYLYAVTCDFSDEEELFAASESVLKGGARILQYRDKHATFEVVLKRAKVLKGIAGKYGAVFIVNDFIEIAREVGADGVHLGQDDEYITHARDELGVGKIVGLSTHSLEQAVAAQEAGADYMAIGPVFSTPTKPGRQAVGLETVKKVAQIAKIPLFAIGGIDKSNINDVLSTGVKRLAVVRAVFNDAPEKSTFDLIASIKAFAHTEQRVLNLPWL